MEALAERLELHCTVATTVPEWFFRGSYHGPLSYHHLQTDVGLVQVSPMEEDVPSTIKALARFYPLRRGHLDRLALIFSECDLVLCDIAPAGIIAARRVGVPSVLLENFTWDWIYEGYRPRYAALQPYAQLIRDLFSQADYHIQCLPVCSCVENDLLVGPVARKVRSGREEVRQRLSLEEDQKVVLVSMGGAGIGTVPIHLNRENGAIVYVMPGQPDPDRNHGRVRYLPPDADIPHPDLVAACDAVVGKVGYSTLAEVYHAGVGFGYIKRPHFRESEPLGSFIEKEMAGREVRLGDLNGGDLDRIVTPLIGATVPDIRLPNGADRCAEFLAALLCP